MAEDEALAAQLAATRPVPAAGFRGALGRDLAAHDPGYGPRPEGLPGRVAAFLAAGGILLALGTLQATGAL